MWTTLTILDTSSTQSPMFSWICSCPEATNGVCRALLSQKGAGEGEGDVREVRVGGLGEDSIGNGEVDEFPTWWR